LSVDRLALAEQTGRNLARARRGAGLSQHELSLRLSKHPHEISRLERGQNCPRLTTLLRIARELEVPLIDLLDGIE
jgi:transcriptional regulator with XRE-family HTH domain